MKVALTLTFTDDEREMIARDQSRRVGDPKRRLATREQCRDWVRHLIGNGFMTILDQDAEEEDGVRRYH